MINKQDVALNGRFLAQPMTGVQRYAMNVAININQILAGSGSFVPIISPPAAVDPNLKQMPFTRKGLLTSHIWEQLFLPIAAEKKLLNLCNTAPVVKKNQIVCIHDANVFIAPESYDWKFRAFYRSIFPLIVNRSAILTTVSSDAALQLKRHLNINLKKIHVAPNGHEHALLWNPALAGIKHDPFGSANFDDAAPFVLALGSRAPHKNLQLISHIAPALKEVGVNILVVGGNVGIFRNDLIVNEENIKFTGRINDHDLAYLMDRALCLVFPSWTEGFGLPILEAMARGCPVISSNRASMPEVCGSAALMSDPDDPRAWILQIKNLLTSIRLRQDLIEKGRERLPLFSWRQTAQQYLSLIDLLN